MIVIKQMHTLVKFHLNLNQMNGNIRNVEYSHELNIATGSILDVVFSPNIIRKLTSKITMVFHSFHYKL